MNKISNIEQKLAAEVLTSRDASGTVRLYREGHFYVAYQGSAVLLREYIKPDLKLQRVVRKSGFSYLKAGVPVGSSCLEGLVSKDADGQWPGSAELSVEAGLGTDFDLSAVEVGNVVARSTVGVEWNRVEGQVLSEIRRLDTLALTPMEALVKLNEWKNRLCLANID
ncbi:MAG: hypothetical protein ACI3ZY_13340 [Parabacteroides sp.]